MCGISCGRRGINKHRADAADSDSEPRFGRARRSRCRCRPGNSAPAPRMHHVSARATWPALNGSGRPEHGRSSSAPLLTTCAEQTSPTRSVRGTPLGCAAALTLCPRQVPNVKLRPPPPSAKRISPHPTHSRDSGFDSEQDATQTFVDVCPRPFKGLVLCATGISDKVCSALLAMPP